MTMRTYALMKPDGVLEIAFQAEGISDAWIFVQDFMQRTVEDLDHSGFTVINVQVWPEGTQPAPVQGNTFWHTMESAPRDRDILLYIGERPADTPWVQGRYIGIAGTPTSRSGYWSSTLGAIVHPTRWAEPPLPEFHVDDPALWARLPERMEVEPVTRVVNHANRTVLRGNGGRWNVIIEQSEWAILPASTREAILDVLRMPEGAERQELEHGLANAVIGIREDRESAQEERARVADAAVRGMDVNDLIDIETVPLDGTFGPVSVDVQEPIVGPATPLVPLPRTNEETIGEAVRRILLDNRDQLMRNNLDFHSVVTGRTSFRIPDIRDAFIRNAAADLPHLDITEEERESLREFIEGEQNRGREENRGSPFQSRIDIVRNADLSIANLFYGVERNPGEHDDNYRNRIIASLVEQREHEEDRVQRPTAPGVEDAIREMSPGVMRGVEAVLTTGELESGVFHINSHKVLRIEVVEHERTETDIWVSTSGDVNDAMWLSKADIEITHTKSATFITMDYQYAVAEGFIDEYE